MVDVGSNLGYFCLLWLAARPDNACLAIEASPRNLALFAKNLQANGFTERCRIEAVAAGAQQGQVSFDVGPDEQTGWGTVSVEPSARSVQVQMRRLDDVVGDEPVSVLKIDVEGADTAVLYGAERLLRSKRVRAIYYEEHRGLMSRWDHRAGDAQRFLESFGYRVAPLSNPDAIVTEYIAQLS